MKRNLLIVLFLFVISIVIFLFTREKGEQKNLPLRFVSLAWQERSIATNLSIVKEWNDQHPPAS